MNDLLEKYGRDKIICKCGMIDLGTIVDAIQNGKLETVEDIGEETSAGTFCGSCRAKEEEVKEIELHLDEILKKMKI